MTNQTVIVGNLTNDPEVRTTPKGVSVANFRVAYTPRQYDAASQSWKDGDPLFIDCTMWRDVAERFAAAASKGSNVILVGRLKQSNWEDKETGAARSKIELEVDEAGFSPRFANITVERAGGAAKASAPAAAKPAPAASASAGDDDGF